MLPHVTKQPSGRHIPERGARTAVVRKRFAPNGNVVVCYPTATMIHELRGFSTSYCHFLYHSEQRLVAFTQVRGLSRPVIPLRVAVDCVRAGPGRNHKLIPDSLQVEWLSTLARAGYHQVTTILEEKLYQTR